MYSLLNKKWIFLYILIFLLLSTYSNCLSLSKITGKVIDKSDGTPLAGASIRLEGTGLGTYAIKDGSFILKGIKKAKYTLLVTIVGYESKHIPVQVLDNDSVYLLIELKSKPLSTGEVVVSANKRIQAVQDVPISISVVSNNDMITKSITRFDEALRYVPGIIMNKDNVNLRGSSGFAFGLGSRVALLVDGFPLLSGDQGDMKYDAIPIFNIEQIEIVKGAGSALYGTGALGGIINIITKEPDDEFTAKGRIHSGFYTLPKYQQWRYRDDVPFKSGFDLSLSTKFNSLGLILSGGLENDESYRKYDKSFRYNIFSKLNNSFSDFTKATLLFNYASDKSDDWVYWNSLDSATIPPTNANTDARILSTKLAIAGDLKHIFNSKNFLTFKTGIYRTYVENNLDINDPEYRQSDAISFNTEAQMNSSLADRTLLTYGLVATFNKVTSKLYGKVNQEIFAGYIQGELAQIKDFIFTVGARTDYEKTDSSDYQLEFSPKLGINYSSFFGPKFRLSLGRGFRAPTVAERFASLKFSGFTVAPNPLLKSEISWSAEIGSNYDFEIWGAPIQFDFAIYHSEFDNLIEPTFDNTQQGSVIKFLNITRARITGIELTLKSLLFGFVGFQTSISAMKPLDLTLNQILKYRSTFFCYNSLFIPLRSVELYADYRFINRMETVDELLKLQVRDYDARVPMHILDFRLKFKLQELLRIPIQLTLNVKNALNYYYTEVVGNLGPTRFIGLQIESEL